MTAERRRAFGIHMTLIGMSFVLSFFVVRGVGLMPGEAIDCMICGFLLIHTLAAVVAICLRRVSVFSCIFIFVLAFFPAGTEVVMGIKKAAYLRNEAPYDRFRDDIDSPVPASVANLHFPPHEEKIVSDLMLQFDIDPDELNAIVKKLKLIRVAPEELLNPKDYFRLPYYMPLHEGSHLFQGKGMNGDVLTIKTNQFHTHAIFRTESAYSYLNRTWEFCPEYTAPLERARKRYEATLSKPGGR